MTDARDVTEGLMAGLAMELLDRDARVVSAIAESNAFNWGFAGHTISNAEFTDAAQRSLRFGAALQISGDQDPDRPRAGDRFVVSIRGTAAVQDGTWKIVGYDVLDVTDPSTTAIPTWATDAPTGGTVAESLPPSAVDYPDDGDASERASREDEVRVLEQRDAGRG